MPSTFICQAKQCVIFIITKSRKNKKTTKHGKLSENAFVEEILRDYP